jgi:hypothetical protein
MCSVKRDALRFELAGYANWLSVSLSEKPTALDLARVPLFLVSVLAEIGQPLKLLSDSQYPR